MDHSSLELGLHSWGANSYGQLGQGHTEDQLVPRLSGGSELQTKVIRVVRGGGGHTAVITEGGEVFVCGQNHKGQLGIGHCADIATFQICPIFSQRITDVACGWDFSLLLTESGKLLACGSNAFGQLGVGDTVTHTADPLLVESLKEPIVSVAAGLRHSLAVNDSGCVYQWGNGLFSHAKRALGPHSVPSHLRSSVPCLVPGLSQKKSVLVKAGSAHCVCLTEEGELFLWGSNKHDQLATSESFLPSPTPLRQSLLNGGKVSNVWSGWSHIIAQTESGRVFTWGRGDYGQLGRPNSDSQTPEKLLPGSKAGTSQSRAICFPAEVHVLRGATQISCGSEHNLAVVGPCPFTPEKVVCEREAHHPRSDLGDGQRIFWHTSSNLRKNARGIVSCHGAGMNMGCVETVYRLTYFIQGPFPIYGLFWLAVGLGTLWQCARG